MTWRRSSTIVPFARSPSTRLQRFNKWCRRNPIVAAISSLAVSFLVALLILSTAFLIRERGLRVSINDALQEKSQALEDTQRLTVDLNKKQSGLQSALELVALSRENAAKQLVAYADSLYAYQISACQESIRSGDWIQAKAQLEAIAAADPDDERRCWAWDFLDHELDRRCKWFKTWKSTPEGLIIWDDQAREVVCRDVYGGMHRWQQDGDEFDVIATAISRDERTIDFDFCHANQCFAIVSLDGHLSILGPGGRSDEFSDVVRELVLSKVQFQPETPATGCV